MGLDKIRHGLHQTSETDCQEKETSKYLNNVITSLINEHENIEIQDIKQSFLYIPGTEGKKTIGWCTDINGLPTNKETGSPLNIKRLCMLAVMTFI